MFEITYLQLIIFITLIWIITRIVAAIKMKGFSIKREIRLLLVYVCIAVIVRLVYFGFHLKNGKIPTLKIGFGEDIHDMISITPLYFLVDRYDGWRLNVIGNIAMFIPVGIVWPICFKQLDTIKRTILAGLGFTLFIEVSQLFCLGRHTDVDDLILNTLGVAIGACIVFTVRRRRHHKLEEYMKKKIGVIVDIIMYVILLVQMLYVFIGNNIHELLGIGFFLCLIIHLSMKNWWAKTILKKNKPASRRFFDVITILLVITIIILMLSSMGVSRFLFTWFHFMGSADLHRYLATAVLTLSVIHGGMHGYWHAKKKKLAIVGIVIASIAAFSIGIFGVPFINRQKRSVEISYADKQPEETVEWQGNNTLVVYFTRIGNTNFEPDVDAVSGASLLMSDGEMMGNNQLLAKMVCDITGFESKAITLTGEKYPSSYSDTIVVAGDELKKQARPEVEPIDVTEYDSIILIYPLWWGSIPMPVATFLEDNDFDGKTIYLIITQGSSGYGNTISEIEELCPNAEVVPGASIYCEDIPDAGEQLVELINNWNMGSK